MQLQNNPVATKGFTHDIPKQSNHKERDHPKMHIKTLIKTHTVAERDTNESIVYENIVWS